MPLLPGGFRGPDAAKLNRMAASVIPSIRPGSGTRMREVGGHYIPEAAKKQRRIKGGTTLIPVRLSAYDATNKIYTGVQIKADGTGHFSDVSPTVTYAHIFEQHDYIGVELGARVLIRANGTWAGSTSVMPTGTALFVFDFVRPRETFAVKVTKDGGAAGPPSTWTYTVTSVDGHAIATAKSPELRRPTGTATTAPSDGTIGTGYYDATGTFHLFDANESC